MHTEHILEQMVLVTLNISAWKGRRTIKANDLTAAGVDVNSLGSDTLNSLGSKRIVSRKALKPFFALKRSAMKLCMKKGIRFNGESYVIPREFADTVCDELDRLKEEFENESTCFFANYDDEVAEWIKTKVPEWQPLSEMLGITNQIRKSLAFSYTAFDVKAPPEIGDNGIAQEVESLYGQLCNEIRTITRHAFDSSFVGKHEISMRSLRPIKAIRARLDALSFLHPSISEMVQVIDDTLERLPRKGTIKGAELNMVAGLVGRQLAHMGNLIPREESDDPDDDDIPEDAVLAEADGTIAPIAWDF